MWPAPLRGGLALDDFFGLGFHSKAEADTAYQIFVDTAAELGLRLQYEDDKTVPPTQKTDFLGVIFCSRTLYTFIDQ